MAVIAALTDAELDDLIKRDPVAALFYFVERAGATMQLRGVPISEQQLRGVAERHAKDRLLAIVAPPPAPGPHIEEHW